MTGAANDYAFNQYQLSSIAGSEYQLETAPGSTTFPFTSAPTELEAGVVLTQTSSSVGTSTIGVSTVNSAGSPIYGYYIALFQGGTRINSCFSTCSFTVNDGQTYQVVAESYGSETFNHWANDGSTGAENISVPSTSTTISLTAVYNP